MDTHNDDPMGIRDEDWIDTQNTAPLNKLAAEAVVTATNNIANQARACFWGDDTITLTITPYNFNDKQDSDIINIDHDEYMHIHIDIVGAIQKEIELISTLSQQDERRHLKRKLLKLSERIKAKANSLDSETKQ